MRTGTEGSSTRGRCRQRFSYAGACAWDRGWACHASTCHSIARSGRSLYRTDHDTLPRDPAHTVTASSLSRRRRATPYSQVCFGSMWAFECRPPTARCALAMYGLSSAAPTQPGVHRGSAWAFEWERHAFAACSSLVLRVSLALLAATLRRTFGQRPVKAYRTDDVTPTRDRRLVG